ncbi:MAG: DegV family EDD domain-containing protein [Calditrichaeota bacterium]|nr:DegV family EDD domain-containing protein [Calditrichota bacterium]
MKKNNKKIHYIDGARLKRAIIAGSQIVFRNKEHLNKINVFPVPDGDTGTNLALTMTQVNEDLQQSSDRSVSDVSRDLADAALRGAQGNSGAILAQFFHGFAEAVGGRVKLTTKHFAEAVQHAKKSAREAMSEPREGTIITVISDWANSVENIAHKTDDFIELLKNSMSRAKQALKETPQKLDVLKKAGVVDAGGQGFVNLLEGIIHFIEKGKIKDAAHYSSFTKSGADSPRNVSDDIRFRYCTECVFEAVNTDRKKLQRILADFGDSMIIVGGPKKFRIHIHTNYPQKAFKTLNTLGVVTSPKVDDMKKQHRRSFSKKKIKKFGVVVDSSCDLPEDFLVSNDVHIIPVRLTFGEQTYRDKFDITPEEFYQKLAESPFHPKSSQPVYKDVKQILDEIIPDYEQLIAILLPRAVSGTFQVVRNAAKNYGEDKIVCVDGKTISGATGLIVMEAIEAIKQELPLEQILEKINYAVENTHIFISVPTLEYLVKGGRISASKGLLGKILRLSPLVSFNNEGKLVPIGKAFGEQNSLKKMVKMAVEKAEEYEERRFIVAHANAPEKAKWTVEQIRRFFMPEEHIPVVTVTPALGVHAGPGAVGLAFLGKNKKS